MPNEKLSGGSGHFGWGAIQSPKETESKDGVYTGGSSSPKSK